MARSCRDSFHLEEGEKSFLETSLKTRFLHRTLPTRPATDTDGAKGNFEHRCLLEIKPGLIKHNQEEQAVSAVPSQRGENTDEKKRPTCQSALLPSTSALTLAHCAFPKGFCTKSCVHCGQCRHGSRKYRPNRKAVSHLPPPPSPLGTCEDHTDTCQRPKHHPVKTLAQA